MAKDFLPHKDPELLAWSVNFSTRITATPTAFGLTAAQATAYSSLHTAFAAALALASEPATRTRGTIAAKNDARTPLKAMARDLVKIIQAYPATTNQQRANLGITLRDDEPSPIGAPTEQPKLSVKKAIGRWLEVELRAQDSNRRGKPEGVAGASVFSYVGNTPPADISAWVFQGNTTRTNFTIEFPPTVPAGSQVYLTAFWFSPRAQSGPACTPISAYIAGGVTQSQAA